MGITEEKAVHIILGGTFNPVHFGHLRIAEEVANIFPNAKISLMPAAYPPHRAQPNVSPEQRIEMLELALASSSHLQIDDRELQRDEPSYSVVTLSEIRQEVANSSVIFLMGTDAFAKLNQWYQWQKLLDLTNILVIERPNSSYPAQGEVADLLQSNRVDPRQLSNYSHGKIASLTIPLLDISSTYIRNQIKCGKSPRFLLPNVILDYIQRHQLYRD